MGRARWTDGAKRRATAETRERKGRYRSDGPADKAALQDLVESTEFERLSDDVQAAFRSMLSKMDAGQRELTHKQRTWVYDTRERLGLGPAENTFSRWNATRQAKEKKEAPTFWWDDPKHRPLKPPGKS